MPRKLGAWGPRGRSSRVNGQQPVRGIGDAWGRRRRAGSEEQDVRPGIAPPGTPPGLARYASAQSPTKEQEQGEIEVEDGRF